MATETSKPITFEDRAKDVQVLHTSKRIIGIPMSAVVIAAALGLGLASLVKIWVGLVIGGVVIFVFYEIYRDDPNALFVIRRRMMSRFRRAFGGTKPQRKIKLQRTKV
ncbi:VirB3 family type IV secretion system protein [Acetobacter persici]|uniref:VirB3 family type IV secretion system protein n=1 Tax=Acetobacter persici TaxID=1076596 RepID=UPI001BABD114|nr:VirB3 family type IV secretion system protein [Acetobacter persici]MBS1017111.1 VirB3 family type IV secretion system protein [Acetobacter persici]